MNKIVFSVLLFLCCLSSKSSNSQIYISAGFGLKPSFEMALGYNSPLKDKIAPIGALGVSVNIGRVTKGTDYSSTLKIGAFPEDIKKQGEYTNYSVYLIGGIKYNRLEILGRFGAAGKTKYQNRFDKSRILSNDGYYFIEYDEKIQPMVGGTIGYSVLSYLNLYVGYDTFSSGVIGVKVIL